MRTLNRLKPSSERGLSIVELMIAMVLGLVLIAGVLQVFLGNRQAQRVEQSVSRIEENGRIAMDLITQDLRATGYYGCARLIIGEIKDEAVTPVFSIVAKDSVPVTFDFLSGALRGFQREMGGVWSPVLTADLKNANGIDGRPGSDAIALYFGQPTGMVLKNAVSGSMDIVVKNPGKFKIPPDSRMLISNCRTTDFFTVTNEPSSSDAEATVKHEATGNSSDSLTSGVEYGISSKLSLFAEHVYFVKSTGRKSPDNTDIYSLWRRENGKAPQELVEGIEFLHFLYGEKQADGKVRYVPATTAGLKWEDVVSVRVSLLAKSFDSVRTEADTGDYPLLDQKIEAAGTNINHSGGLSLRRVYTATVELRNLQE